MQELNLENVVFEYPEGRRAVDGVTFSVERGESVGLVGANGAGKSTLLMMLPGALLPVSGAITVLGQRLSKAAAKGIRRQLGLVLQDADDQLFTATVGEDVAFGPRNMGLKEPDVQQAVRRALDMAGIAGLAGRAPYRISGGEKKLAAIAAVLSMDPQIIVMDEPSASLDPKARRKIIELLRRLPQTKLIASHDLDLVWDVCSRVIVMREGKIAADGEAKAILSDGKLMDECGLELPLRFGGQLVPLHEGDVTHR